MELYDKKYVYFDWDDKLEGKKGFVAQNIMSLKGQVYNNPKAMVTLSSSDDDTCPFTYFCDGEITYDYQFAYYDPDYEAKKALMEGKTIQIRYSPEKCDADVKREWVDVNKQNLGNDFNFDDYELRLKPEIKWYVILGGLQILGITKDPQGKHVYFKGTEDECSKWIDKHKHLADLMQSWEQGKTIQYNSGNGWEDCCDNNPSWEYNVEYRIKDTYVPFDTVDELIKCWEKKFPGNANRPEYTMPLIWIKNKEKNRVYLITDFLFEKCYGCDVGTEEENLELSNLFKDYTFLDGSIIGKKKE